MCMANGSRGFEVQRYTALSDLVANWLKRDATQFQPMAAGGPEKFSEPNAQIYRDGGLNGWRRFLIGKDEATA